MRRRVGCSCLCVGFSGLELGFGLGFCLDLGSAAWEVVSPPPFWCGGNRAACISDLQHSESDRERKRATCCHNAPATCNLNRQHATCNARAACSQRDMQHARGGQTNSIGNINQCCQLVYNYYC